MKDNKQILILELTSLCNSNCKDCLRKGMNKENYMMKFDDVKKSLNEIAKFSKNFSNFEVKLSGGEPTIWRDDDKDIVDIINECKNHKLNYSLVTNGKIFSNEQKCINVFKKMSKLCIDKINIYVTIDIFHNNYEKYNENKILDNILKYKNDIKVNLFVQSTVTRFKDDNLPIEFIRYYRNKNVGFLLNPLLPWGKGEDLLDIIPYLNLKNNDKTSLGDYEQYLYILGKNNSYWNSYEEFIKLDNLEIIKRINCCGKTITFMENSYYYCMPCSGKEKFKFSSLGSLSYKKYIDFINKNQHITKMKKNNFDNIELLEKCPIGYGICGLCRKVVENEK